MARPTTLVELLEPPVDAVCKDCRYFRDGRKNNFGICYVEPHQVLLHEQRPACYLYKART